MAAEILPIDDDARLARCEAVIERGLKTFVDIGNALAEIRDAKLYRQGFRSFEEYCEGRWGLSRRRAYQVIEAAGVVADVKNFSQAAPPKVESQATALAQLPPEERGRAWEEAVEAAPEGKVTAKHVEAVVDKKLGKPPKPPAWTAPEAEGIDFGEPEPEASQPADRTPPPAPRSKVNGVLTDDPPDVAALRKAGKLRPDVVPEIDEPEPEPADPTPAPEPEPEPDELSDEEWLATLPLHGRLDGAPRRWFAIDALLYRAMEPARKSYQGQARRALAAARRKGGNGEFAYRLSTFLKVDHPKDWKFCGADGGCGGTGVDPLGKCARCHGRGYWIL